MKIALTFNKVYFILAMLLLLVEVLIALFIHDDIIRPYIGDVLVVILIYCFVKSFLKTPVLSTSIGVFIFACFVEMLQYFNIVNRLGLQNSSIAKTVIGTSFQWLDIVAYAAGIIIVLFTEQFFSKFKF